MTGAIDTLARGVDAQAFIGREHRSDAGNRKRILVIGAHGHRSEGLCHAAEGSSRVRHVGSCRLLCRCAAVLQQPAAVLVLGLELAGYVAPGRLLRAILSALGSRVVAVQSASAECV